MEIYAVEVTFAFLLAASSRKVDHQLPEGKLANYTQRFQRQIRPANISRDYLRKGFFIKRPKETISFQIPRCL